MKSWTRTILFAVITAAFLALSVVAWVNDGPWWVSLSYVACGTVTGLVALKVRPSGSGTAPAAQRPGRPPAGSARRSGNPAKRAAAKGDD